MNIMTFALSASNSVSWNDVKPIFDNVTAQVNVSNIVTVVAAVAVIAIGLVFMWWAARKAARMIMGAFRKGKLGI